MKKNADKKTIMKKIILLLLVVALGVTAVMTCPEKKAHRKAILLMVNSYVDSKIDDSMGKKGIAGAIAKGLKATKKVLGAPAASVYVNKNLQVDNYYLFSLGKLTTGDEPQVVSIGVFGYVLTPSNGMLTYALDKSAEEAELEKQLKREEKLRIKNEKKMIKDSIRTIKKMSKEELEMYEAEQAKKMIE